MAGLLNHNSVKKVCKLNRSSLLAASRMVNGAMKSTSLSCKPGCDYCDRFSRNDFADTSSQKVYTPAVVTDGCVRDTMHGM